MGTCFITPIFWCLDCDYYWDGPDEWTKKREVIVGGACFTDSGRVPETKGMFICNFSWANSSSNAVIGACIVIS